jgi:hypothetical protein
MAGCKVDVHGQPLDIGEFDTHSMFDLQPHAMRQLKEVSSCQVGYVGVTENLFPKIFRVLGHFGGADTPGNLSDLCLGVSAFLEEGGRRVHASFFVSVDPFHVANVVKPRSKDHHLEVLFIEVRGRTNGPTRSDHGFRVVEIVILHPSGLSFFNEGFDVGACFLNKRRVCHGFLLSPRKHE